MLCRFFQFSSFWNFQRRQQVSAFRKHFRNLRTEVSNPARVTFTSNRKFPLYEPSHSFRNFCIQTKMDVFQQKEKYLNMNRGSKRSEYKCGSKFITLESVPTWKEYSSTLEPSQVSSGFQKNDKLNMKISVFKGDITCLEIDAIVNAANTTLKGGGGVDGCIHKAAGPLLVEECITLNGCPTGDAKITGGFKLPAKYVIHTVGPVGEKPDLLKSCYEKSLQIAKDKGVKSIAFPCISTGVYGYPNEAAAHVALKAVRTALDKNPDSYDRIIFCLFLPIDIEVYEALLPHYFPV